MCPKTLLLMKLVNARTNTRKELRETYFSHGFRFKSVFISYPAKWMESGGDIWREAVQFFVKKATTRNFQPKLGL